MKDVFISYSRRDVKLARKIQNALEQYGLETWMDEDEIEITTKWRDEIIDGIESSNNFVFIISPDSLASPACNLELADARSKKKRIIPIVYRGIDSGTISEIAEVSKLQAERTSGVIKNWIGDRDITEIVKSNWSEIEHFQWSFFEREEDFDVNVSILADAIRTDYEWKRVHTDLTSRAKLT